MSSELPEFIIAIRQAAERRILFLPHAVRQMSRDDRMITPHEVEQTIVTGDIIEEYPEDVRGHSALLLGVINHRPIHVVCSPKEDYLVIITAYRPNEIEWSTDFRRRLRK